MSELTDKLERIRALIAARGLDGMILQRSSSFAWATCGAAAYVNTASTTGAASLLITPDCRYVITNNIEAPRLEEEEHLKELGWEFDVSPWYEKQNALARMTEGMRVGSDLAMEGAVDLSAELARLRSQLTPQEGDRFRHLGRLCAAAMQAAIQTVRPGQSEHEIASILARENLRRGVQVIVNLVATDERVFSYRHPLHTTRKLERYAMLVLCGRRAGLVCSITRLIHFGSLPAELRQKMEAAAQVDATLISATNPGSSLAAILDSARQSYAQAGFPDEWQNHHQGGAAGYEPREFLATPSSQDTVQVGQVYAWNPSIAGVKSEDSILVGATGNEILTETPGWPVLEVEVGGHLIPRPAILEIR